MKVNYLFDQNNIVDMFVSFYDGSTKDDLLEVFHSMDTKEIEHDWLTSEVISLKAKGKFDLNGKNQILTITLNNKPIDVYVNLTNDELFDILEKYLAKEDEYRKYNVIIKNYEEDF